MLIDFPIPFDLDFEAALLNFDLFEHIAHIIARVKLGFHYTVCI